MGYSQLANPLYKGDFMITSIKNIYFSFMKKAVSRKKLKSSFMKNVLPS